MGEQFSLKWNNYQISLTAAFKHILEEEDFVDVTLSAEGQSLKAHKVCMYVCLGLTDSFLFDFYARIYHSTNSLKPALDQY